jgi:hypothetical protein
MKIVIPWSGSRVLDEPRRIDWCGEPEFEIGVAVSYEPHSAGTAEGNFGSETRKSDYLDTDRCQHTGTPNPTK